MDFLNELALAGRRLWRHAAFTSASVLTLGVGIGATVAMFAVVYAVVINPLPYPESDRLVELDHAAPGVGNTSGLGMSLGLYVHYDASTTTLDQIAIYSPFDVILTGAGDPVRLTSSISTAELADVMRVQPLIGRFFVADDMDPAAPAVTVLSHALWSSLFGADPAIVGRSVTLNSVPFEVVGVMPASFAFPSRDTKLWLPQTITRAGGRFGSFTPRGVARMTSGADVGAVQRELTALIPGLIERFPGTGRQVVEEAQLTPHVIPLKQSMLGGIESTLWLLLAAVAVVLLVAGTNVANLLLVRAEGRQHELAVRAALGAARSRVAQYFFAEGVWLAALGGSLGLGLAGVGLALLRRFGPEDLPRLAEVGLRGQSLVLAAMLSAVAGVVAGGIPMLRRPAEVALVLKSGARATTGRGRFRSRHFLIVSQTALAFMLVVGAGLMVRSYWHLTRLDLGFDSYGALTFELSLPQSSYQTREAASAFHEDLLRRLRTLPGAEGAAATTCLPLCGSWSGEAWARQDRPPQPGEMPPINATRRVTDGYFEVMRIGLVEGRMLDRHDHEQRTGAAVVNRRAAQVLFSGEPAIGKRIYPSSAPTDSTPWYTVVGVVENTPVTTPTADPAPTIYLPLLHADASGPGLRRMQYVVRTAVPPLSLANGVRREVLAVDGALPISSVRSLRQIVHEAQAGMAFTMAMIGIAAVMALFLGVVGIYSVISYIVSQRTAEFGIRLAVGARAEDVEVLVLRQGGVMVFAGVGLGLLGALVLSRFMRALVFGVPVTDLATYAGVTVVLILVALGAIYGPARRAARVDPMRSLRAE